MKMITYQILYDVKLTGFENIIEGLYRGNWSDRAAYSGAIFSRDINIMF